MYLLKVRVLTEVGTFVKTKMLADYKEVQDAGFLAGKDLTLGCLYNEEEVIKGSFDLDDISVEELPDEEAEILKKHLGTTYSELYLFDFFGEEEEKESFSEFIKVATDHILHSGAFDHEKVAAYMTSVHGYISVKSLSAYNVDVILFDVFSYFEAESWNKILQRNKKDKKALESLLEGKFTELLSK